MINYPTTLPCPLLSGNSSGSGRTFLRSMFEYSTRQRGTYCNDYTLSYNFLAKDRQTMLDFKNFYFHILTNGSMSFNAAWEIEGNTDTKEFRFIEPYKVGHLGTGIYKITAQFEMLTKIKDIQ